MNMMAVESRICIQNGLPRLIVNGQSVATVAYITYFTERNHYKDFSDAGYGLFSLPIYFGGRGINPMSHIRAFNRGIFDVKGEPDFSIMDKEVGLILEVAPDAMIFPRVNLMMPEWWCTENPLECNDAGIDGDPPRECFASRKWKEDAANMLRQFIAHIEASDYRKNIVGYQISDGMTEEWFPFDNAGGKGLRAREAFAEKYGENVSQGQWYRFISEIVTDAIAYFAKVIKEYTQRRLVVGCFYGYTLEVQNCDWGHHAVESLLDCPDVDFFCSPSSYLGHRSPGEDWPAMTAIDSVILHGKMSFVEYDTRTHLTRPLREARPNGCLPGTYEGGVWEGPKDPQVSRWLLKNNVARQFTHGNASWWFDMWGGWFADPDIMADMELYRKLVVNSLWDNAAEEHQVAVIADEQMYCLMDPNSELPYQCCSDSRSALGKAGAPYAHYQMVDFDTIRNRYRAFVFLAPILTERMKAAIACCERENIPYYIVDSGKVPLTAAVLREFYKNSGVHIWCDTDDVVYAGNGWLSIHASSAGQKAIYLPKGCRVEEVAGAGTEINTGVLKDHVLYLNLQQFETRLFRIYRN